MEEATRAILSEVHDKQRRHRRWTTISVIIPMLAIAGAIFLLNTFVEDKIQALDVATSMAERRKIEIGEHEKRLATLKAEEEKLKSELKEAREALQGVNTLTVAQAEAKTVASEKSLTERLRAQFQSDLDQVGRDGQLDASDDREGFLVVLGSYRYLKIALSALNRVRTEKGLRDAELFLARNQYYAVALEVRNGVNKTLERAKQWVPGAYLYNANSFPVKLMTR